MDVVRLMPLPALCHAVFITQVEGSQITIEGAAAILIQVRETLGTDSSTMDLHQSRSHAMKCVLSVAPFACIYNNSCSPPSRLWILIVDLAPTWSGLLGIAQEKMHPSIENHAGPATRSGNVYSDGVL